MLSSAIPTRIQLPFAAGAAGAFIRQIPVASQIGVQDGAASFTDGFPPLTFQPIASGGVPPFGQDENGILNIITKWNQWQAVGGAIPWDAAFSTAIGGYPQGAIVGSTTSTFIFWISGVDNNTSNPDAGGANWFQFSFFGIPTTGDVKLTLKTVADAGWALINADPFTFGSATSGANFANAVALALYTLIWTGVSNTFAPVSGGRGANAAGDFAANKTIAFPRSLGRALGAAGAGSGLTSRSLGQFLGEENHQMTLAELVAHVHSITDPGHVHGITDPGHFHTFDAAGSNQAVASSGQNFRQTGTGNTGTSGTGISINAATTGIAGTNSAGSSTPFNVMQPTTFFNLEVKL